MKLELSIPAVAAAGREGLDLSVTRLEGPGAERLLLASGSGAAILELGAQEGFFVFAHGKARLEAVGDTAGRAFVDAVAAWLGLELEEDDATARFPGSDEQVECSWVRLGGGADPFGVHWDGFKLFLSQGDRHAEVFFRRSSDGSRAQLVEKWSEYRRDLVDILERSLAGARPRRTRQRRTPDPPRGEGMSFGVHGALDVDIPDGWLLTEESGHWRAADPDDEMKIEFSFMRLPPLPSDAPGVVDRLRTVVSDSEHGRTASPISTFEREGTSFAWSEYTFDSSDTKDPAAAPRPARGRWLIASNAWIQVLVTGCWWETDVAVAERAWDGFVGSLRVGGRIAPATEVGGRA